MDISRLRYISLNLIEVWDI